MTENPFQLPGYQVIGMQDTGVAFDVHLQPPSPVACSSCGTIGDFVKNGTRDIRVMDLPVHGKPGERQKFCVHGIIGARQTGASNEHEHQTQFS